MNEQGTDVSDVANDDGGLSASIVLYNNDPHDLRVVIECFLGSGSAKKLFLIDNSLTNRLEREIPLDPRIQYEHNDRNTGYVAHNVAMRKSIEQGFKYHVVLNPDISCDSAVFQKISQFMDNSPDVGLLLPKIFYPDGRLQYACKLLPTPRDFLLRLFFPRNWIEKQMNTFELRVSGYDKIMDVPYMSGCFMFLRNSVLEKVGLFDERFFMYAEDIDLSRRIHAESRSVFYPDVSIVHRHEAASYKNPRLFWIHLKNVCQYFNKYGWFLDKHRRSVNRETLAQFEP